METPKEKGELIDKYLNYFEGLEILSLKSYAETGKVSGSLYLAVNKLLDEYAESKTAQLKADKEELLEALEALNENYKANNEDACEHLMCLLPPLIQKMKPTNLNLIKK